MENHFSFEVVSYIIGAGGAVAAVFSSILNGWAKVIRAKRGDPEIPRQGIALIGFFRGKRES